MGYLGNAPADQAIQIGSDTILSSHIDDGVIVNADINASAAIATSKVSGALTSVGSHGLATSATTDTTSASNISSGTLAAARVATLNQNTTGTAATVTTAAQPNITSVGTLTGLTVGGYATLERSASSGNVLYINNTESSHVNSWALISGGSSNGSGTFTIKNETDSVNALQFDTSSNATFAGKVVIPNGQGYTMKNNAGNADLFGLWATGSDYLRVGNDSGWAGIEFQAGNATKILTLTTTTATFKGDISLDNGNANGANLILKSSGNTDWSMDNSSGGFRLFRAGGSVGLALDASYNATFVGDISMTGGEKKMKLHNSSNTVTSMLRISNRDTFPSSGNWADEYICEIHGATTGTASEVLMFLQHHENGSDRPILRAKNSTDHVIELGSNELYKFRGKLSVGNTIFDASEPLHVKGTSGNIYARIETTAANSAAGIYLIGTSTDQSRIFMGDENSSTQGRILYMHATDSMEFWANDTRALNINQDTSSSTITITGQNDGSNMYLDFNDNNGADRKFRIAADGGNGKLYFLDTDSTLCYLDQNSTSWEGFSDSRWKKNVSTISGGLDKVNALRGVNYKWNVASKKSDTTTNRVGFIAQEVKDIIPEAVGQAESPSHNDDELYYSVKDSSLIPVMVEAIKELSAKVEALENA